MAAAAELQCPAPIVVVGIGTRSFHYFPSQPMQVASLADLEDQALQEEEETDSVETDSDAEYESESETSTLDPPVVSQSEGLCSVFPAQSSDNESARFPVTWAEISQALKSLHSKSNADFDECNSHQPEALSDSKDLKVGTDDNLWWWPCEQIAIRALYQAHLEMFPNQDLDWELLGRAFNIFSHGGYGMRFNRGSQAVEKEWLRLFPDDAKKWNQGTFWDEYVEEPKVEKAKETKTKKRKAGSERTANDPDPPPKRPYLPRSFAPKEEDTASLEGF